MRSILLGSVVALAALLQPAQAANVAGVELDETARPDGVGSPLVLNGAGIRRKFFFKIYVGALYLPKKLTTVEAVLNEAGPKRVLMHFLYKRVDRQKLVDGWTEGFNNNSRADMSKLEGRLADFNRLFTDTKRGDVILLDYLPQSGTRVTINGETKGTIPGADFNTALLKVWLGAEPADAGLKQAMLGGSNAERRSGNGGGGGGGGY